MTGGQMLAIDQTSDELLAMLTQAPSPPGPDPAGWERLGGKPKRPKANEVVETARTDRDWHADWLTVLAVVEDFLELRVHGRFNRDKEALASGEIEHYFDPTLRNEHDKGVEELSSYEIAWESPNREFVDNEERRAKGDGLAYVFELWERQHDLDGMGDLRAALPDEAMRKGVIASSHVVDVNAETGIRSMLYDPATVYPSFERGRGLARVICSYRARADEVIAKYGNDPAVARKLKKVAKDGDTYDPSYEFDLAEWWDRNWVVVVADEIEVYADEHGRQVVPFVVTFGNYGKQRHTNQPATDSPDRYNYNLLTEFGVSTMSVTRRDERMYESQPFCYKRLKPHIHKEAIGCHLTTHVRDAYNPATVWQRSLQERTINSRVETDVGQGGQTHIGADAKFAPLKDLNQLAMALGPLGSLMAQYDATSGLPPVAYGAMPGSQTSGTAAKQLSAAGKQLYRPVARHIARHLAAVGEMWLGIWRDYGDGLGPLDAPGMMKVPRRAGSGGAHEVTAELLKRSGTRVTCTLVDPDPLGDIARVNAGLMAGNSEALSWWTVRKAMGADPDLEQERIDRQHLAEVPEVGQKNTLRLLLDDIKDAQDRGDQASMTRAIDDAKFIAQQMWINQLMKQGAAQAMERSGLGPADPVAAGQEPPVGPGGAPMLPGQLPGGPPVGPGGAGAPSGANFQGAAMPDFGIPTGTQGGRPPAMMPGEV